MTATLKHLRAQNALTYKNLSVPLDNQGLVLITGENKDSPGSNGSGKSSIWELLCHLMYGVTGKGLSKKGIINQFVGKEMLIELDLEVNGTPYLFREARKHSEYGTNFFVYENGTDVTPKRSSGKSEPQQLMQEIIGFNLQEYLGLIYLCQSYHHVLVQGTRSEKDAYLSALFGLDKYGILCDEAKLRVKEVNAKMSTYQSYERDLEQSVLALAELPALEEMDTLLQGFSVSRDQKIQLRQSLTQEVTNLQALQQQSAKKAKALEQLAALNFPVLTESAFQAQQAAVELEGTTIRSNVKSLETMLQSLKHRQSIVAQMPAYPQTDKSSLQTLNQELQQRIPANQILVQQVKERNALKLQYDEVEAKQSTLPSLEELDVSLAETRAEYKVVQQRMSECDYALRSAQEAKASLDSITGSTCPTCHRDISEEAKSTLIAGLDVLTKEQQQKEASEKTSQVLLLGEGLKQQKESVTALITEKESLNQRLQGLPVNDLGTIQLALQKDQEDLTTVTQNLQVWSTIETLVAQLAKLPEGEVSAIESMLAEFSSKESEINSQRNQMSQASLWIRDANLEASVEFSGSDLLLAKQQELDSVATEIDGILVQQATLNAKRKERLSLEQTKATAENKLKEAEELRPRQIYLPKLVDAFGAKGLKTVRLDLIMEQLVQILPHYLGPLFAGSGYKVAVGKNLEFELSTLHDGKQIVLPGKGTSGGERKSLDMATLFGLRTLRTSYKSANILIVDEPYGDLDASKRSILTDLFQQLKTAEAVSSVFVITHEAEVLQHSFDKVWTVVRENNESTLQV